MLECCCRHNSIYQKVWCPHVSLFAFRRNEEDLSESNEAVAFSEYSRCCRLPNAIGGEQRCRCGRCCGRFWGRCCDEQLAGTWERDTDSQ